MHQYTNDKWICLDFYDIFIIDRIEVFPPSGIKKVFYICTDIQHIYILYLHIYLVIQSKYFVNNIKNNSRNVTTVLNEQFHFSSIVIMLWNNYKHKYSFM